MLYRFESVDPRGAPIHGILEAEDESQLREMLLRRGQRLVSAQPQTVLGSERDVSGILPRMVQLRVGESLRAAFLTQIPAQDALRAAAREPFMHPLAGLFPWLMGIGVFLLLLIAVCEFTVGSMAGPLIVGSIAVFAVIPTAWLLTLYFTETKPRRLLNHLADRLDAGESDVSSFGEVIAEPQRSIVTAELPDATKARVLAELASRQSPASWGRHRFALSLLGSYCLLFAAGLAIYGFLMVPVPVLREVSENFDMDVSIFAQLVFRMSSSFEAAGLFGLLTICFFGAAGFLLLFGMLYLGWGADQLESIPVLGTGLNWVNLARIGRILAVLLRNDCPPGESLRIATRQYRSGVTTQEGARLAERIDDRHWIDGSGSMLDGLPVSVLLSIGNPDQQRRRAVAASTFDGLAAMFEQSASGYGAMVSAITQLFAVLLVLGVTGLLFVTTFWHMMRLLTNWL